MRPACSRLHGRARLDDAVAQPAPLRHGGRDRRPRDLADPQPSQPGETRPSTRSIATRRSAPSSASARTSSTRSSARRTGSAAGWSPTASASGRVFICGDAAHLWMPYAGYGMNAGIADAANLAWLLGCRISTDGRRRRSSTPTRPSASRSPSRCRASRWTWRCKVLSQRRAVPAEIEDAGPGGRRRARPQSARPPTISTCSNIAAAASTSATSTTARRSSPMTAPSSRPTRWPTSRRPRCRAAARRISGCATDGSLYDALGPGYTLLRLDPDAAIAPLDGRRCAPAACRSTVVDLDAADAQPARRPQAGSGAHRPARGLARRCHSRRSRALVRQAARPKTSTLPRRDRR